MLNIKFKKSCLVRCVFKYAPGLTYGKLYNVVDRIPNGICVYNNFRLKYYYNEKYFEEVKSNEQK